MKKITILSALLLSAFLSFSQDGLRLRKITLKITVIDSTNHLHKGFLHTLTDSGLFISPVPARVALTQQSETNTTWMPYKDISALTLKKKRAGATGVIVGAIAGGIIGAIIGGISYKEPDPNAFINFDLGPGFSVLGGALMGVGSGVFMGVVTSAIIKKRFVIRGREERYREMYEKTVNRVAL